MTTQAPPFKRGRSYLQENPVVRKFDQQMQQVIGWASQEVMSSVKH